MRIGQASNIVTSVAKTDLALLRRGDTLIQSQAGNITTLLSTPSITTTDIPTVVHNSASFSNFGTQFNYTATKNETVIATWNLRLSHTSTTANIYQVAIDGVAVANSQIATGTLIDRNGPQFVLTIMTSQTLTSGQVLSLQHKGNVSTLNDINGKSVLHVIKF